NASVEKTSVRLLVRDFDTWGLAEKERMLEALAQKAVDRHQGSRVEIVRDEQYRNMKEVLDSMPQIAEYAEEAVRRAGLEVHQRGARRGAGGGRPFFLGAP